MEAFEGATKVVGIVEKLAMLDKSGQFKLKMGVAKPGDVLLHEERSEKHPVTFGFQKHVCRYKCRPNEIITCVVALDDRQDGTGGSAEIIGGGVNHDFVEVEITSQFYRGFEFTVSVYGTKK